MTGTVLAEDGGTATLTEVPWEDGRWFELRLEVEPARRGRGIGGRLWAAADRELTARGATLIDLEIRDDDPVALAFAEHRGFAVTQRLTGLRLDLTTADPSVLAAAARGADGVTVGTLAEAATTMGREPAEHRLYELNRRLAPDVPGNGEAFPPYDVFRAEVLEAEWFRPEHQYVAAAADRWVGLAGVGVRAAERTAAFEFTAVDRAYRRRGIATALKARAALDARALGLVALVTGNDATNEGILAVNRALGFRPDRGILRLQQRRG